jgi:hypothetical protein
MSAKSSARFVGTDSIKSDSIPTERGSLSLLAVPRPEKTANNHGWHEEEQQWLDNAEMSSALWRLEEGTECAEQISIKILTVTSP